MTPASFAALVRVYTHTDSTSFTDPEIMTLANIFKDELCRKVEELDDDFFTIPQTRPLIAGQREYTLPSDMLSRLRRLEVDLTGTGIYVEARSLQFNIDKTPTDESSITRQFSDQYPQYYLLRSSLWLLTGSAIVASTLGLKLWSKTYPSNLVDLTSTIDMSVDPTLTSLGFPRALHELLARRVSIVYKSSRPRPLALNDSERQFDMDLHNAIESMTGFDAGEDIEAVFPYNDGSNY